MPIGVAVSGQQSCELFAPLAQVMVGIEPDPELGRWWDAATGRKPTRKVAQLPICWDADADAAKAAGPRLFRWSLARWKVNAELPGTAAFDSASAASGPPMSPSRSPVATMSAPIVTAARKFFDAGYTDLALVQIGGDQQASFFAASAELLAELNRL